MSMEDYWKEIERESWSIQRDKDTLYFNGESLKDFTGYIDAFLFKDGKLDAIDLNVIERMIGKDMMTDKFKGSLGGNNE